MQKVEKWRLKELAHVVYDLVTLLGRGNDLEWSKVFLHYYHELEKIISEKTFSHDSLNNLIRNIKSCFSAGNSFIHAELQHEDHRIKAKLNQDFRLTRGHLLSILSEMEYSMRDSVN